MVLISKQTLLDNYRVHFKINVDFFKYYREQKRLCTNWANAAGFLFFTVLEHFAIMHQGWFKFSRKPLFDCKRNGRKKRGLWGEEMKKSNFETPLLEKTDFLTIISFFYFVNTLFLYLSIFKYVNLELSPALSFAIFKILIYVVVFHEQFFESSLTEFW